MNKTKRYGIYKHDKNRDEENAKLLKDFIDLSYKTSQYSTFKIYEPKEREIYRLPYYPDRIAHHAIMNVMEGIWRKVFVKNTYSSIRGRGIHKCAKDLYKDLQNDPEGTTYCLKLDIHKFYPSIDHDILFSIIQKKVKDKWLLKLLREIIDSAKGVPIGNYLSQFFANLYLTYFDHWMKENVKCKHYFRYADDIVVLSDNKQWLRNVLVAIKFYFHQLLKLQLKPNYSIFPVESRGIDFIGYVFKHKYVLLRKTIKVKAIRLAHRYNLGKISKELFKARIASYKGWLKFCNSKHLTNKIQQLSNYRLSTWNGQSSMISNFNNKYIYIVEYVSKPKYFELHAIKNHTAISIRSKSQRLYNKLKELNLPYSFKYEQSKFKRKTKRN